MTLPRSSAHLDTDRHPMGDESYIAECRERLDNDGALVLAGSATIEQIVIQSAPLEGDAFYTDKTHNVYLTPSDPSLDGAHPFNRQVESSKGLIADDEIPRDSPLRDIYNDASFLCGVLVIDDVHRDADVGDMAFERVGKILDGDEPVQTLEFARGDLARPQRHPPRHADRRQHHAPARRVRLQRQARLSRLPLQQRCTPRTEPSCCRRVSRCLARP